MLLNARFRTLCLILAATLLLAACSTLDVVAPGREKVDYKKSKATEALEVPPDLSSQTINDAPGGLDSASSTLSAFNDGLPTGVSMVLPDQSNMQFKRDGDQQWLVVQGKPSQVWPKVREFWLDEGFLIKTEDPRVGIIETGWSENRADIPKGPVRNVLGKVMDFAYSAATRDQYRVRLERGAEPLTTEVYLTHRGVREVIKGSVEDNSTVWEPRPSDPELEAEMLKRMMVYLGIEQQKAESMLTRQAVEQVPRARMVSVKEGSMLVIDEDFSRAWRRTGVALDRVGFAVEDRNRSEGIYYVRYNDPLADQNKEGVLSKLSFWSSDEEDTTQYQIEIQAQGAVTHILVNNAQGRRDKSGTAKRILSLLEEELR